MAIDEHQLTERRIGEKLYAVMLMLCPRVHASLGALLLLPRIDEAHTDVL